MNLTEPRCTILDARDMFEGRQRVGTFYGVADTTCGSRGLSMHLVALAPGQRAVPHRHELHESCAYALEGRVHVFSGERLEHHDVHEAGRFVYIPAGVLHVPVNLDDGPFRAVIARTDAAEQESIAAHPELDGLLERRIAALGL